MLEEPSQKGIIIIKKTTNQNKLQTTTNQNQTYDTEQIPNKSRDHLRLSQTIRGKSFYSCVHPLQKEQYLGQTYSAISTGKFPLQLMPAYMPSVNIYTKQD